jgi:UDPglucose 6-dehydrogenase
VWGLTFKARTDDLRDSPALAITERLVGAGATVRAYDPTIDGLMAGLEMCRDPYAACEGASVLAVLTEWDDFRWLDYAKVASVMATPQVVDARNLLDRASLTRLGFTYRSVGHG